MHTPVQWLQRRGHLTRFGMRGEQEAGNVLLGRCCPNVEEKKQRRFQRRCAAVKNELIFSGNFA
jgi:hypothetical protein